MQDANSGVWTSSCRGEPGGNSPLPGLTESILKFTIGNDPALFVPIGSAIGRHLTTYANCSEQQRFKIELALHEALANAMFHGNLEVASELRLDEGSAYYDLADQRRRQPPYCHRTITVQLTVDASRARLSVSDQGPGFDTSRLENLRPPAPELPCGRGLLLMRSCMDRVTYNKLGNRVRMTKQLWPVAEVA